MASVLSCIDERLSTESAPATVTFLQSLKRDLLRLSLPPAPPAMLPAAAAATAATRNVPLSASPLAVSAAAVAQAAAAAAAKRAVAPTQATSAADLSIELQQVVRRIAHNQLPSVDFAAFRLDLSRTGALLAHVHRSSALKRLSFAGVELSDAALASVAQCVCQSRSIAELDLESCALRASGVALLAAQLGDGAACALTLLNLACNGRLGDAGASAIAAPVAHGRLQRLSLAHCGVASAGGAALGAALAAPACALTHLDVSHNRIGDDGASAVVRALHSNGTLQALSLAGNPIGDAVAAAFAGPLQGSALAQLDLSHTAALTASGLSQIAAALVGAPRLAELRLVGTATLPSTAVLPIASSLTRCKALTHVDLFGARIGATGVGLLCDAINVSIGSCALVQLGLRGNAIGVAGASHLAKLLGNRALRLRALNLAANSLRADGLRALAAALTDGVPLDSIDLSGNELGDAGVAQLASVLRGGSLQRLSLALNNIGVNGARTLAAAIAARTVGDGLAALDLSWNLIGAEGVRHLAPALRGAHAVADVSLAGNRLGDDGAQLLSETVLGGPGGGALSSLLVVDVSHNSIRAPGAQHIGALIRDTPLLSCALDGNELGDDGTLAIANALKAARTLQRLSMRGTGITAQGSGAVCEAAQLNPILELLDLRDNVIADFSLTALHDAVARNNAMRCLLPPHAANLAAAHSTQSTAK
jgi:Ran GTPase-activating protein (RanGAP) involved in mRNA processing and transport